MHDLSYSMLSIYIWARLDLCSFLVVVQGLMYNGTKGRRQTLSLLIVLWLRPFGAVQQQSSAMVVQ